MKRFIPLILSVIALGLSIAALVKSFKTSAQVADLTTLVVEQNKEIAQGLKAINSHLDFYDHALSENWMYFYGVNGNVNIKQKK